MENFGLFVMLSLIVPILALLLIISIKIVKGKKLPESNYTPFDYITGQTTVEFHEQKEAKEENDDQGDDKDRY
ncbi:DUF3951 domain-containing protein [Paenibacillus sp. N1-5-1-14]|uniref:DUF3951 domain-containing protein n=1 Tax=Paenibacillus radicibacter TaxID=2972488 RepID=UPI0021595E8D|nr:DUF3951 domain-containing protein [Paenibacillus radicibacter]MCR8641876.1 DUF3951 domain-containing protein [Paenibacillus radicibacter]